MQLMTVTLRVEDTDNLSDLNTKTPPSSSCRTLQGQETLSLHPLGISNIAAPQKSKSAGHFFLIIVLSQKKGKCLWLIQSNYGNTYEAPVTKTTSQMMQ